jgi:hypothetical protein
MPHRRSKSFQAVVETGEALVFVVVVIVTIPMPPAIVIRIAMPISATPLQAANHSTGDVFARIRFPPTASILVAYHSNLIDAVVAPERT